MRVTRTALRSTGIPEDGYIAYETGYMNDGPFHGELAPMQVRRSAPQPAARSRRPPLVPFAPPLPPPCRGYPPPVWSKRGGIGSNIRPRG